MYFQLLEVMINSALTDIIVNDQQDDALLHYALRIHQYLGQHFPRYWNLRRGNIKWPRRSPDFSPLFFFLWGT